MGTQKSNMFDAPFKYMVPEDKEIPDRPLPSHWTPSMQAYNTSGSTPTPFLNQQAAGSHMPLYMWVNQVNNTLLQSDALHDPRMLSSKPTVAGDAVLAFSEIVHRTFGEQNLNSIKKCARNLQPKSLITKESTENGSKSSIMKTNRDGVLCSEANGNKGSPDEDHITNDFPSTKKQHCNLMLENGDVGQNTSPHTQHNKGAGGCNEDSPKRLQLRQFSNTNNLPSHHSAASSTKLNQDLETGLDASDANAQLVNLEKDEIRRERKRQSNRESARRSRMRKEKECEELHKQMEMLKDENSVLTQRLKSLSEECLEICNENDAIEEELIKMYGPESIADLLLFKPT
ncbi:G-box-binding factor 1 [Glycine max]|uniref:G-box-binding factor 1 isoform B n=1 Tax=Glycine soja TaxID=3848 RepID=A0A445EZB4_GLYSO|nr:G-box-binding factor 1 [Glycine max]RZB41856.1 G-box-binding factor 1 isoform B [Glycine soja]